jgi:DNA (cytosine-5)-methyltransferase 1
MTVKIGSLFAGIGGFELGLERAIPNSKAIWQVEQNTFCQGVLRKHWPEATIFDDVRTVGAHNLQSIHLLCGGFPCQDISVAGKQRGIHDSEKSSLWWEMHRIISELRPRIVCLENVANVLSLGGSAVVGSLAEIGYDCEWTVVRSGSDFGAPHHRARWFCVAYPSGSFAQRRTKKPWSMGQKGKTQLGFAGRKNMSTLWNSKRESDWRGVGTESAICRMDDGIPAGMDSTQHNRIRKERLKALGNAIVPQASEWLGRQIVQSGLIDDLID